MRDTSHDYDNVRIEQAEQRIKDLEEKVEELFSLVAPAAVKAHLGAVEIGTEPLSPPVDADVPTVGTEEDDPAVVMAQPMNAMTRNTM